MVIETNKKPSHYFVVFKNVIAQIFTEILGSSILYSNCKVGFSKFLIKIF